MALGNTAVRVIVSVIAIPLVIFICYIGGIYFWGFTTLIAVAGYYEFNLLSKAKNNSPNLPLGYTAVIALMTTLFFNLFPLEDLTLVFIVSLLFYEIFRNKNSALNNMGATLLGVFYAGVLPGTVLLIRELYSNNSAMYDTGGFLIISLLATIWACDSAAFFVGSAIGEHKLFPRVSPKKSWEGAIAGFIFSVVAMIVMKYLLLEILPLKDAVIIGLIVGIFGQTGDLAESLLKRDAGVKDSSNIIPGHGGILDRFDSLLFTAPMVYLYLKHFSI